MNHLQEHFINLIVTGNFEIKIFKFLWNEQLGVHFFDIFPTEVSAIELSYDNSDVIEEFTVTFQVQYWAPGVLTDEGEDDE